MRKGQSLFSWIIHPFSTQVPVKSAWGISCYYRDFPKNIWPWPSSWDLTRLMMSQNWWCHKTGDVTILMMSILMTTPNWWCCKIDDVTKLMVSQNWWRHHIDVTKLMTLRNWWCLKIDDVTKLMLNIDDVTKLMTSSNWWCHQIDDVAKLMMSQDWWCHKTGDIKKLMTSHQWWIHKATDVTKLMTPYDVLYLGVVIFFWWLMFSFLPHSKHYSCSCSSRSFPSLIKIKSLRSIYIYLNHYSLLTMAVKIINKIFNCRQRVEVATATSHARLFAALPPPVVIKRSVPFNCRCSVARQCSLHSPELVFRKNFLGFVNFGLGV